MGSYKTIIIGGGISGLACANKLATHQKDFLLITENIGGDINCDQSGNVNYGAYAIGDNAKNIQPYIRKTVRFKLLDLKFHKNNKSYSFLTSFKYPLELLRIYFLAKKFQKQYEIFKKNCETTSQKQAFEKQPYLLHLYKQNAEDFIIKNRIIKIVHNFLGQVVYMCTFTKLKDLNAFDLMHVLMHIDIPIYEFIFEPEKLIKDFKNKIIIDSVEKIIKNNSQYILTTKNNTQYTADKIVLATPPHIAQKLISLDKIKGPCCAHMSHIQGEIKKEYSREKLQLFDEDSDIIFISNEPDKTHLLYSQADKPDFDKYFKTYEIISHKYWNPAFNLKGDLILDAEQSTNLFMIGEYNITGVEDCFITGIYAANQILANP